MKIVTKLQRSKIAAVTGLFLLMAVMVFTMVLHAPWWAYIYLFFLFMSEFSHLCALITERMNPAASRKLERVAVVCGVIGIVAVVVEAVLLAVV